VPAILPRPDVPFLCYPTHVLIFILKAMKLSLLFQKQAAPSGIDAYNLLLKVHVPKVSDPHTYTYNFTLPSAIYPRSIFTPVARPLIVNPCLLAVMTANEFVLTRRARRLGVGVGLLWRSSRGSFALSRAHPAKTVRAIGSTARCFFIIKAPR